MALDANYDDFQYSSSPISLEQNDNLTMTNIPIRILINWPTNSEDSIYWAMIAFKKILCCMARICYWKSTWTQLWYLFYKNEDNGKTFSESH